MKALKGLLLLGAGTVFVLVSGCISYPNCETDKHCADYGEYCVDKMCRQCRDNSHCNASDGCKVCTGYRCVTRPGCCHSDLDCPSGACRKAPGAALGECFGNCKDDSKCPAGQKCVGNMCVPAAECGEGIGACAPGHDCIDGRCVEMCRAEAVYFDYNESKIRVDQREPLARTSACIKRRQQRVTVEGHCDQRGTDEYNMALGQRRAAAIQKYLKGLGVTDTSIISYGEERPVCGESHEGCWKRNRRGEFLFK